MLLRVPGLVHSLLDVSLLGGYLSAEGFLKISDVHVHAGTGQEEAHISYLPTQSMQVHQHSVHDGRKGGSCLWMEGLIDAAAVVKDEHQVPGISLSRGWNGPPRATTTMGTTCFQNILA